jgi:hypothetical protein
MDLLPDDVLCVGSLVGILINFGGIYTIGLFTCPSMDPSISSKHDHLAVGIFVVHGHKDHYNNLLLVDNKYVHNPTACTEMLRCYEDWCLTYEGPVKGLNSRVLSQFYLALL